MMRKSRQRAARADDPFDRREILAFCDRAASLRRIQMAQFPGVSVKRNKSRFEAKPFRKLKLRFRFRDRKICLHDCICIYAKFFIQCFDTDPIHKIVRVDIEAEIALNRAFRLRLRGGHHGNDVGRAVGHRMHVRRCAADIDHYQIADRIIQQLCRQHNAPRRRQDRPVDHITDMFHARRIDNVFFKHRMNDFAYGFYVQFIQFRIHVVCNRKRNTVLLGNTGDDRSVLYVTAIDDRRFPPARCDHTHITDGSFALAVIGAARKQDQIRMRMIEIFEIELVHLTGSRLYDDRTRAERRCLRGAYRHIANQSVHRHPETASSRTGCKHAIVRQRFFIGMRKKIVNGIFKSDPHIAVQNRCRRFALCDKARRCRTKTVECVDDRRC